MRLLLGSVSVSRTHKVRSAQVILAVGAVCLSVPPPRRSWQLEQGELRCAAKVRRCGWAAQLSGGTSWGERAGRVVRDQLRVAAFLRQRGPALGLWHGEYHLPTLEQILHGHPMLPTTSGWRLTPRHAMGVSICS